MEVPIPSKTSCWEAKRPVWGSDAGCSISGAQQDASAFHDAAAHRVVAGPEAAIEIEHPLLDRIGMEHGEGPVCGADRDARAFLPLGVRQRSNSDGNDNR